MTDKKTEKRPQPSYRFVEIEKLRFDPTNPRLGTPGKTQTQDELQAVLEAAPHSALQLLTSLEENGFIPYEPLIVKEKDEEFVVIEGNRRLAACRHILANPAKFGEDARNRLIKLPVLIFPSDTPPAQVRNYLAVHHLFGFKEWPPYSKALFLDKEIKSKRDISRLVQEFGIDKQEIKRYLLPYRVAESAGLSEKDRASKDFWILGEALGRAGITSYLQLAVNTGTFKIESFKKEKFIYLLEFLYGKGSTPGKTRYSFKGVARISDTRELSQLGKVLASERASAELEKGSSLEEALVFVEAKAEAASKLVEQIEKLLDRFARLAPDKDARTRMKEVLGAYLRG